MLTSQDLSRSELAAWLLKLGCKRRHKTDFILDEFDNEIYLHFDMAYDTDKESQLADNAIEHVDQTETCDIHIVPVSETLDKGLRIAANMTQDQVAEFLFCIGLNRFNSKIQELVEDTFAEFLDDGVDCSEEEW